MRNFLFIVFAFVLCSCGNQTSNSEESIYMSLKLGKFNPYHYTITFTKNEILINGRFLTEKVDREGEYIINRLELKEDLIFAQNKCKEWDEILKKENLSDVTKEVVNKKYYKIEYMSDLYYKNKGEIIIRLYDLTDHFLDDVDDIRYTSISLDYKDDFINNVINYDSFIEQRKEKEIEKDKKQKEIDALLK